MHSIDKRIESIINWRMRTYEKVKAVKRAEQFFEQHRQTNWINYKLENEDLNKEKAVKSSEKIFAQHRQTNRIICKLENEDLWKRKGGKKRWKIFCTAQNNKMNHYKLENEDLWKEKAVKSAENFFAQHKQIESIVNWRMRTYEKEKAVKSAEKFFAQHRQTNWINYKLENEDLWKREGGEKHWKIFYTAQKNKLNQL